MPALICLAGDVWDDGNPHSRHHLMRRLAGEFEVLFVEGVPMRSLATPSPEEWRRAVMKLSSLRRLRTVAPHLHVLRPLPIPPAGPIGRRGQIAALRVEIEVALRRLDLRGPRVLWFSLPNVASLRGRLGDRGSILYYQDRYEAFSHVDAPRLRAGLAELARGCDIVVATAHALAQDLRDLGADPLLEPHGVDASRFSLAAPMPEDIRDLEQPLVGYVGLLDDYVSLELINATARRMQRGSVVLVGGANIKLSGLREPRVKVLGRRPYEEIPSYLANFDCCLIPFEINRLTEGVNPIKLREYLAAGRRVVSTALPEVEPYSDVVTIAPDFESFPRLVVELLEEPDSATAPARRRERVAGESWDAIANRLAPRLREVARSDGRPAAARGPRRERARARGRAAMARPAPIVIDALAARFGGSAYAAIQVARHLSSDVAVSEVVAVTRSGSLVDQGLRGRENIRLVDLGPRGRLELVQRVAWEGMRLPRLVDGLRDARLLSWSGMLPRPVATPLTCYLANPVMFAQPTYDNRLRRSALARTAHRAAHVLVPTHAMATIVAGEIDRMPEVVPLGVEHERFRPAGQTGEDILYVGDFYAHKRHDVVLAAWAALSPPRPRLCFVGDPGVDPANAAAMAAQARALERLGVIEIRSGLKLAELVRMYQRARVVVLSSEFESFAMPLLEAQACGVPVVARDLPALRETGGSATSYVSGDAAEDWADAIARLIEGDEAHSRARAAAIKHAGNYSWQQTAAALRQRLLAEA